MNGNLVIAIGREFGSGGHEVASRVAEKLGIKLYDKELIALIAKNSGMSEDIIREVDETAASSFLYALSSGAFVGASVLNSNINTLPLTDKAFLNCSKIIKDIADKESCVILGRCAETVLAGRENLLTVFIHADINDRIERISNLKNISRDEAETLIKKTDKKRAAYHNYYAETRWGSRNAYDICLNSALGIDTLVDVIVSAAKNMIK